MRNAGLDKAQTGIKIARRNINMQMVYQYTSDMQMIPLSWQKQRRTKEPLDENERRELKSWLKAQHSENEDHGILSHHFMANRRGNSENSG